MVRNLSKSFVSSQYQIMLIYGALLYRDSIYFFGTVHHMDTYLRSQFIIYNYISNWCETPRTGPKAYTARHTTFQLRRTTLWAFSYKL